MTLVANNKQSHFMGALVTIYNSEGGDKEYLIIDGQQRLTSISLLLLALHNTMKNQKVTRILYGISVLLAIYQIIQQNYVEAASALGVGLVFDPFDPKQTWKERPVWKKTWLIVHLAIVAALFGLGVGIGDK